MRWVTLLAVVLTALLGSAGTALAATEKPERPTAEAASEVRATSAVLHGTLDPGKTGEPGTYELDTYEFVYRPSTKGECEGSGQQTTSPGMSLGAGKEEVPGQPLEGLAAGTEYAACFIVHNGATPKPETATSTPISFTTAIPPEAPADEQATEVTATTATLKAILNPSKAGEPGTYRFSYAPSASSCTEGAQQYPAEGEPELESHGAEGEAAQQITVTGLQPATTYSFCIQASNAAGETAEGRPQQFVTLTTSPSVTAVNAADAGATTATVSATINPHGLSTSYYAEYVTDAEFEAGEWAEADRAPAADAELPAASTATAVSETLPGLQPATGYHFRFVAANAAGTSVAQPGTFTTPASTTSADALPDSRAYELVSTSGSAGELYKPPGPFGESETGIVNTSLLFQVARDGERVAYIGGPSYSSTSGNGSVSSGNGNQWLATRAAAGWGTEDINPPGTGLDAIYQGFSSNLATAVLVGERALPLAPQVSVGCTALYARASEAGHLTPLFTKGLVSAEECGAPHFAGASEDGSQIIFESTADLASPAREGATTNLFESTGGHLSVVNVLGNGEVPDAAFAGENAISRDGTRIFWVDSEDSHLYVLENGSTNIPVSRDGSAEFLSLTPDGQYAYYSEEGALWRFDTATNSPEQLEPSSAGLQGLLGASEDGSYAYFVADQALAPGATAKTCASQAASETEAEEESNAVGCNLYMIHEGLTSFIAVLSPQDASIETEISQSHGSDWTTSAGARAAEVTPDGRSVVLQSHRRLSRQGGSSPSASYSPPEVFVYAAGDGQLACASCTSVEGASGVTEGATNDKLTSGGQLATEVPDWISSDGSLVFFESKEALVRSDTNGVDDVYEWEREGSGSCSVQRPSRPNDGCVSLLSGGESPVPSFLVGADASGNNVFFTHTGPLGLVQAPAGQNELYDARVDGGFTEDSLACTGTGCQAAPPAAPSFATPPSVTFTSTGGNFVPAPLPKPVTKAVVKCKKGRTLRRGKCVKRKTSRRTKSKRANSHRRTHR